MKTESFKQILLLKSFYLIILLAKYCEIFFSAYDTI